MCNCCKCNCCSQASSINSDDVYYSGPFLPNITVNPNEELTSVIQDINSAIGNIVSPTSKFFPGEITFTPNGTTTSFTIINNVTPTNLISAYVIPGNLNTSSNFIINVNANVEILYSVAPLQGIPIKFYYTLFY